MEHSQTFTQTHFSQSCGCCTSRRASKKPMHEVRRHVSWQQTVVITAPLSLQSGPKPPYTTPRDGSWWSGLEHILPCVLSPCAELGRGYETCSTHHLDPGAAVLKRGAFTARQKDEQSPHHARRPNGPGTVRQSPARPCTGACALRSAVGLLERGGGRGVLGVVVR